MKSDSLSLIEQHLGINLPPSYAQLLRDQHHASMTLEPYILSDPREILLLNLELRMTSRDDVFAGGRWPQSLICIGSDECGNYYGIDAQDTECAVQFFDHEADVFETKHQNLADFVRFMSITVRMFSPASVSQATEAKPPLYNGISSDEAVVTRAEIPRESVIHPITLAEWEAFVKARSDLKLCAYRTVKNPFREEEFRIPCTGLAIWSSGSNHVEFQWVCGRIVVPRPGQSTLDKLELIASSLQARLVKGWEVE